MKARVALILCVLLLGIGSAVAVAQDTTGTAPTDIGNSSDLVSGDTAAAEGSSSPVGSSWTSMIILIVVFAAIFYFMLIRPQRKRQAKMNDLIGGLKRGDQVITAGGIHGEIDSIGDTAVVLVLEDGAKIRIAKTSVVQKRDK